MVGLFFFLLFCQSAVPARSLQSREKSGRFLQVAILLRKREGNHWWVWVRKGTVYFEFGDAFLGA